MSQIAVAQLTHDINSLIVAIGGTGPNSLVNKISGLVREQEKLSNAQERAAEKQEEYAEILKEANSDTIIFKNSLSNLKSEILEVQNVTKDMGKSTLETLSYTKYWTAASRLLSGTGLWSIQNAARGVIDVLYILEERQKAGMEQSQKASKAMENYEEVQKKFNKIKKEFNELMREGLGEEELDKRLKKEYLSYRLLRKQNVSKEAALKMLKEELSLTHDMLEAQKKGIEGEGIRRILADKRIKMQLKIQDAIKGFFGGRKVGDEIEGKTERKIAQEKFAGQVDNLGFVGALRKRAGQSFGENIGGGKIRFPPEVNKALSVVSAPMRLIGRSFKIIGQNLNPWNKGVRKRWREGWKQYQIDKQSLKLQIMNSKLMDYIKKRVVGNLIFVLGRIKMAFMWIFVAIFAIAALMPFLKSMWKGFKQLLAVGTEIGYGLLEALGFLWLSLKETIGAFFGMIHAAFTGDFPALIEQSYIFIMGLVKILVGLLWVVATTGITLLIGFGAGLFDWIITNGPAKLLGILMYAGLFLIGYHIVTSSIAYAVTVAMGIIAAIPLAAVAIGAIVVTLIGGILSQIGLFSSGGVANGLSIVGEKGPELINLPKGTRVHSNADSRKMISKGNTNNINVSVNGRLGASDQELRNIARKVGSMVSQEINRTTASSTRGL